eukprot:3272902-Rhodomonas_salina.1
MAPAGFRTASVSAVVTAGVTNNTTPRNSYPEHVTVTLVFHLAHTSLHFGTNRNSHMSTSLHGRDRPISESSKAQVMRPSQY